MAIDTMKETRRRNDSKRLTTLKDLVNAAGDISRLSIGRRASLIDQAVQSADGLHSEKAVKTFQSECRLVLNSNVAPDFGRVLSLAEQIWQSRETGHHSRYHVIMRICKLLKGSRFDRGKSIENLHTYYAQNNSLP